MKYTSFNKHNIKNARIEVQNALDKLGKEMGCKITMGRITYGEYEIRSKIEVVVESERALKETAPVLPSGITMGKKVTYGGVEYTVVGYKPRSNKYPVVVQRRDGRKFKLTLAACR